MKRNLLLAVATLFVVCSLPIISKYKVNATNNSFGIEINEDNFPDQVLRNELSKKDIDGNGFLSSYELNKVIGIYVYDSNITDLSGVELLPELQSIECYNCNSIEKIDVSKCKTLTKIDCHGCRNITEIIIDGCDTLTSVNCEGCSKLAVIPIMSTSVTCYEQKTDVGSALISGGKCTYSYEYSTIPKLRLSYKRNQNSSLITLKQGIDYNLYYENSENVGTVTVVIEAIGNYSGKRKITYESIPADISNKVIASIPEQVFTGKQIQPYVSVVGLINGTDYTVTYSNNISAGVATVTATGKGNYTGSKSGYFIINPKSIEECSISPISAQTYTGAIIKPPITIMDDDRELVVNQDYTATYPTVISPGTRTITIEGKGNYTGTVTTSFKIVAKSIVDVTVLPIDDYTFCGQEIKPSITVMDGAKTLEQNNHYTVSYINNINAGTATVTIKGRYCYKDEKTIEFEILPKSLGSVTLSEIATQYYSGSEITPDFEVNLDDVKLVKNVDYTTSYANNIDADNYATVTVNGIGNYKGSKSTQFYISKAPISRATVSYIEPIQYTGVALKPSVILTDGDKQLVYGADYVISFSENVNVGEATGAITGKGNYYGTQTFTFQIIPDPGELSIVSIPDQVYTGSSLKPEVIVKAGDEVLSKDSDYIINYSNNKNVGTAIVSVQGIGNYSGSGSTSFSIVGKPIFSAVAGMIGNQVYSGSAIEPEITIIDGSKTLLLNTDYSVSYLNNINAGTATVQINGKGNYTGTMTTSFIIVPLYINLEIDNIDSQIYTGCAIEPDIVVSAGSKILVEGTDYSVSYSNNTNVGTASVSVTAKGNYIGSAEQSFTINARSIAFVTIDDINNCYYTGEPISPSVVVKDGTKVLSLGIDYTVSYMNNTNLGQAKVTIIGMGNYSGVRNTSFIIVANESDLTIENIPDQEYSGSLIEPSVAVKCQGVLLTEGQDYTVSFSNNISVGLANVSVAGKGNYLGTGSASFNIVARSINEVSISEIKDQTYTGSSITPEITITDNKTVLQLNVDYTVSYEKNVNAGTAFVKINGIGNYKDSRSASFVIVAAPIDDVTIDQIPPQTYTGDELKPLIIVRIGSTILTEKTDYIVSYTDNVNAGMACVNVAFRGNYSGSVRVAFVINAKPINGVNISAVADQKYTGSAINPSTTVKDGDTTLVLGIDYDIAYSNNINVGIATFTITGKRNYSGEKSSTFNIVAVNYKWKQKGSKWYYVGDNGEYATDFMEIDGKTYYFNNSGVMQTKWQQIDGTWYYFGTSGDMKTGWQKISKVWYYFGTNGKMATGLTEIGGAKYLFKSNGSMLTGWQQIGSDWYYFASSGAGKTGWQKISKVWYYFDASGKMLTGLNEIDGEYYYFKSNGSMVTKWLKIDSDWYWFKSDGSMAVSETVKISGKSYKFDEKGICLNP